MSTTSAQQSQRRGPGRPRTQTFLPPEEVERVVAMAANAEKPDPKRRSLKGQGEAAIILRKRGFGVNEISRFLCQHGAPVSPSSVSKFLLTWEACNARKTQNS